MVVKLRPFIALFHNALLIHNALIEVDCKKILQRRKTKHAKDGATKTHAPRVKKSSMGGNISQHTDNAAGKPSTDPQSQMKMTTWAS